MENAIFRKALLREATFSRAIMDRADLSEADLIGANFEGARLEGAILSRAILEGANFWGADLRGVVDLNIDELKRNAKHWEMAFYSEAVTAALGLPPNHNECETMRRLRAQYHDGPAQQKAQ